MAYGNNSRYDASELKEMAIKSAERIEIEKSHNYKHELVNKQHYTWAVVIVLCTFLSATVLCISWVKVVHIKTQGTIRITEIQTLRK